MRLPNAEGLRETFSEALHSEYKPLDSVLKSKFQTDFVPGKATYGQGMDKASTNIKEIIVSAKRLKDNLILKDMASAL